MTNFNLEEAAITKMLVGFAGAVVSLRFVQGSLFEKVLMVLGGSFFSFYGAPWVANKLGMHEAEGLVGFLMGLFGMALITKGYEVVQLINASEVVEELRTRFRGTKP